MDTLYYRADEYANIKMKQIKQNIWLDKIVTNQKIVILENLTRNCGKAHATNMIKNQYQMKENIKIRQVTNLYALDYSRPKRKRDLRYTLYQRKFYCFI
jgi:hypothetical protein